MKHLTVLLVAPVIALGLSGAAHADERPDHFEGERAATLDEALAHLSTYNAQLQAILAVRERYGVAVSRQIDIPDVSHRGMLVMVHQLADADQLGLTVLNFANEPIAGTVRSEHLVPGSAVTDMFHDNVVATVDDSIDEASADVTAVLTDGRREHVFVEHAIGSLQRPMSDADLERKCHGLSDGILTSSKTDALIAACRALGDTANVRGLTALARP